jgi:hypothetical protein
MNTALVLMIELNTGWYVTLAGASRSVKKPNDIITGILIGCGLCAMLLSVINLYALC